MQSLRQKLASIQIRPALPDFSSYSELLERTISLLEGEPPALRPRDRHRCPGGLLRLSSGIPTIIVPDLHARPDFFLAVLDHRPEPASGTETVLDLLSAGKLRLLCLGDGFHSERQGIARWIEARDAFSAGSGISPAMDAEMRDSLSLMEMVMECKCAFPEQVHFLKGNHENVLNEEGHGNHPFRKYADEGEMVREYLLARYGPSFLFLYASFEKALPVCAVGERFMASHAEPRAFYAEQNVIDARDDPALVEGLTWTDNGEAEKDSVGLMLARYLPDIGDSLYFGGHRVVSGGYATRAGGRFVQLHDPERRTIAVVPHDRPFNFSTDIRSV